MKVSILIPVVRDDADLAEALASVSAQTYTEWELIVVQDVPNSEIAETLREFATVTRRPVRHEKGVERQGMVATRNRLLELATGDALAFLDIGDAWAPRHLGNAIQQLTAGADVVVSDARLVDPKKTGRSLNEINAPAQLTTKPARTIFTRDVVTSSSCIVMRRELATRVGRFDPRFQINEGRDFWLRCALAGGHFAATHRATCRCTKHVQSQTARALLVAEQSAQFYEKHRDVPAVPAALRRRLLAASLVTQGRLLRKSDPAHAARCFWRAWSLQPVQIQTLGQFALTGWQFAPSDRKSDIA